VYIALSELRQAKAQDLSERSGVPRGKIYEVLTKLEKKNLITIIPSKPKKYKINEIKKSIDMLIGIQISQLEDLRNELQKSKFEKRSESPIEEYELIQNEEIYFEKLKDFKKRANKEYLALINGKKPPRNISLETRQMINRKVKSRTIISELTNKNDNYINQKLKIGAEIRISPLKGFRFVIIDKKEILFSLVHSETLDGITLYSKNKDFINSFVGIFDTFWKEAEKPKFD
jgi:sugar-specific transcriptional regulator TrmB